VQWLKLDTYQFFFSDFVRSFFRCSSAVHGRARVCSALNFIIPFRVHARLLKSLSVVNCWTAFVIDAAAAAAAAADAADSRLIVDSKVNG